MALNALLKSNESIYGNPARPKAWSSSKVGTHRSTPASTEGSGELFNITIPPPTDQAAFDTSVRVQLDLKQ